MTDKLELKSSHEVVYTVYAADVESIFYCKPDDPDILTVLMKDGKRLYCDEVCPIDSLQKEPVSKGLEKEVLHGKRCSKCGAFMKADISVVYTSIPPMYMYHCPKCGNNEYGLCSENY